MLRLLAAVLVATLVAASHPGPSAASPITAASISDAAPNGADDTAPSLVARAEILLERAHFSPGEIDALDGDNFRNAVRAFQQAHRLVVTGKLDAAAWSALASPDSAAVLKSYTISDADLAGPFTKAIPGRLEAMARLSGLSYTSPLAELAEKFHMSQDLLRRLNPRADFKRAGTQIVVADLREMKLASGRYTVEAVPPKDNNGPIVATIVVDKPARNLRAYDQSGNLLAFYPASIGSEEKPAPSGVFKVRRVNWNPAYVYDPRFAWKGVKTHRKLVVAAGPNNPVGLVWIDLTAPSYGIHGTPAPEAIGKTESHGCIRLTNWNAVDLASMARPGTVVRFDDEDSPVAPLSVPVSETGRPKLESKHP